MAEQKYIWQVGWQGKCTLPIYANPIVGVICALVIIQVPNAMLDLNWLTQQWALGNLIGVGLTLSFIAIFYVFALICAGPSIILFTSLFRKVWVE